MPLPPSDPERTLDGGYTIPLTKGYSCVVCEEGWQLVKSIYWIVKIGPRGIVYATGRIFNRPGVIPYEGLVFGELVSMHRYLRQISSQKMLVHHRDNNTLNNRIANLVVTDTQGNNSAQGPRLGSSRYKGVSKGDPRLVNKTWRATICVNQKVIQVGYYATETEAAEAYNEAARRHFGELAYQNPIQEIIDVRS